MARVTNPYAGAGRGLAYYTNHEAHYRPMPHTAKPGANPPGASACLATLAPTPHIQ
jgi:hypothetical protein